VKQQTHWVTRPGKNSAHLAEVGATRAVCGTNVEFCEPLEFNPDGFCCHLCEVKSITDAIPVAEVEEQDLDYQ